MITFRLADALPASLLATLSGYPTLDDAARRQCIEAYLDAVHGRCHLRDTRVARLVEAAAIRYIHDNAVKAGLVDKAEDWPYGSTGRAGATPALPGNLSL